MATVTINNKNVQEYINKQLIDPYSVKIDLNTTKTASDNVHRWVTLADAIKSKYKFNFDYDIKDLPSEIKTLPEVTVTAPMKMYSVGAGEMRPFNSVRQASEYVQQHPKKDASESALNWLLAGIIAAPAATTIGTAGYIGDRLFHDAVQLYNGEDIDKNGMWVYNPGGWIAGYAASKVPQATKALYSFGRTNIGTKGSRLSYVLDKNLGNLEVPKTLDFGGIKRVKWGDAEFDNPNLYYHIDKGNYKGYNYPKIKGGYLKQGYFYPGDSPNTEQIAYSWWNKGNPYTFGNDWNRLIISAENPQFIHVRSQPYKIGQWDPSKKKSFVTNSEYVASQPVKISPNQVFYFDKYRNGWYRPPARMRYIFGERPSIITTAERMGIPKSERNNFNRFQKDALEDLENYINSGQYRQTLYINPETRLISYEPKEGYVKLTPELVEGKESFTISPEGRGTYDINFKEGIPHVGISEHKNLQWIPEFGQTLGEVELFGGRFAPYNFRLTAPRTDAINLITESPEETLLKTKLIDEASPRINKEVMKDFWIGVSEAMRPSSYLSADAGKSPLGYTLINMFEHRNKPLLTAGNYGNMINKESFTWEDIVNAAINKTKWESRKNGLSTDSYLALLKQAAREGSPYELRYSPDGFTVFNDQSIDNKFISDLLVQAQKGEIPKEKFLEEFHKWVEPYGGMDAKIVNGEIIIPHPFLYKRKLGGKLIPKGKKGIHIKKENKGKFTEYCGGKVTNECIQKGKNSPDPKIRKRATFAGNVRKWNKKK